MTNPALIRFPDHARLMGTMVLSYPELVITFSHIVGLSLGIKYEVFEALHSLQSETNRINAGRALAAKAIANNRLTAAFDEACSALLHCSKIRNLYAHNLLSDYGERLYIVQTKADLAKDYDVHLLEIGLLEKQLTFFGYTRMCLLFLEATLAFPKLNRSPPAREERPPATGKVVKNSAAQAAD